MDSDWETIDWSNKPVVLFKELKSTKFDKLYLEDVCENFDFYYGNLSKHHQKGINKLTNALVVYLVEDKRKKYKSFGKFVSVEKVGIKENWHSKVVDGFYKLAKYYLAVNIPELFSGKIRYSGGAYNAQKYKFKRRVPELEKKKKLGKFGKKFVSIWEEHYMKHLEENEIYSSEDSLDQQINAVEQLEEEALKKKN